MQFVRRRKTYGADGSVFNPSCSRSSVSVLRQKLFINEQIEFPQPYRLIPTALIF